MLDETALERYSRQIIVPEVGGRGQERLLAARVGVVGEGDAARAAVDLLTRAGVRAAALSAGDVLVDLSVGWRIARQTRDVARPIVLGALSGAGACVTTVVGRPCAICVPDEEPARDSTLAALAPAAADALGALAALEALRVLLLPPARGRRTVLDFGAGLFRASELAPVRGCTVCGAPT
jgi:molybdopterin/thiamine biosynthesis adenylyltransferase